MKKHFSELLVVAIAVIAGCTTSETSYPTAAPSSKTADTKSSDVKSKATDAKSSGVQSKATEAKPSKPKTFAQKLSELQASQSKRRISTAVSVEELIKFRDEVAGTNRANRTSVEMWILGKFKTAGVQDLADKYVPALCKPALADKSLNLWTRLDYAESYCRWLAGEARYDEADKIAASLIDDALKEAKPNNTMIGRAYLLKASCRRWRDDGDGAFAAAKEAMKYNLVEGRKRATDIAIEYDRPADALALWDGCDPYTKICAFHSPHLPKRSALVYDLALAYALCPTNPPAKRSTVVNKFFSVGKTPDAVKARAAVKDVYCEAGEQWWMRHDLTILYLKGDWKFFAEMYEYAHLKSLDTPGGNRAYVFALAASGQTAKALAKADEYLKTDDACIAAAKESAPKDKKQVKKPLDKKDRAKLEALKAIVSGKDALVPLAALKDDPKAYAEAVRKTATWCLNLQKNDECRRYSDAYQSLVKPQPKRRYDVKWFDAPVTSISDWRRVWDQLEKTLVNYKMTDDLDNLVTDVSTGRVKTEKTDKDTVHARFEVTSLCDVNGLSIFLRVEDPNARLVERGLAGGLCTEMYLAAGDNQPYLCFGSEPRAGLCFSLQTAYTSKEYTRLNVEGPKDRYSFLTETAFTDNDYVLRLFFPWDAFYQKLPKAGTEWKFECLNFFGPDGNFSWAGSKYIHESSSWGRLVFNLKPEEERAIKRRLIYATYKNWNVASHGEVAPFDKWADPVIGDPEFYKFVKPLETELVGYQKRVTAEMSDADVDEIYAKGVIRWLGIRHELDGLRREYLLTK